VALKVDVIVAWSLPASETAREATARIPIVTIQTGNPAGAVSEEQLRVLCRGTGKPPPAMTPMQC
jgi:hypothetical protein